jgi:DNA adenine methylase
MTSKTVNINKKPKPFVKWVGGKRQLLKQFFEKGLYPKKFNAYHEPFVGGGAVFFELTPEKSTLSDLNSELVTTYNIIKKDVESLITSLKRHKHTKEYFLKMRSKDVSKLSDVQIASRFIYLNRTAFNGMYRVNKQGIYNVPFGKYKNPLICDEENLRLVSKVLKKVSIKNQDYMKVLDCAKKGDFVYFDPPYYPVSKTASFTSYTSNVFLEKEQEELRDTFEKLHKKGCYVMLSNSDTDFIKKIYSKIKGIKIHTIEANRAINSNGNGRGKVKELVITNY